MDNCGISGNASAVLEDVNAAVINYINAVAKSTVTLWNGIDEITRNVSGLSQESFSKAMNAYTEIAGMKSSQEIMAKQAAFAKEAFDDSVTNGNKVSELSMKVAKEAIEPLSKNANEAVSSVMNKIKPK